MWSMWMLEGEKIFTKGEWVGFHHAGEVFLKRFRESVILPLPKWLEAIQGRSP